VTEVPGDRPQVSANRGGRYWSPSKRPRLHCWLRFLINPLWRLVLPVVIEPSVGYN
jgi:hypothetical protein